MSNECYFSILKRFRQYRSRNVIAEIKGSTHPRVIIAIGGHSEAWDVGQNAGGCLAAWQALKIIKAHGYQPKRTIRFVTWTNEVNGLRDGTERN